MSHNPPPTVVCVECGHNQTYADLKTESFGYGRLHYCNDCLGVHLVDFSQCHLINSPSQLKLLKEI